VSAPAAIASLSLDLDDRWVYLRTRGVPGWASAPSYLETVARRALEVLHGAGVRVTCFSVGRDAAAASGRPALAALAGAGHEIGNHAFSHGALGSFATRGELELEIARTEEAIHAATGQRPVGFRGPGYTLSAAVVEALVERGYLYDATVWPTYLGAVTSRLFMRAHRSGGGRGTAGLFGGADRVRLPNRPFRWSSAAGELVEIPVTTVPFVRFPLQVSYLVALRSASRPLARHYLRRSLSLCRRCRVEPSLILHPPDLLGAEDAPDLAFFPAMRRSLAWKREAFRDLLGELSRWFSVVTLREHAAAAGARPDLRTLAAARLDRRAAAVRPEPA
jgi:hypothetical protein